MDSLPIKKVKSIAVDVSDDEDSVSTSSRNSAITAGGGAPHHGRRESQAKMDIVAMTTRLELLDEIRHRLFDEQFKFPAGCRHCTNIFVVFYALACGVVTSIWCLWFDVGLNYENDVNVESECLDSESVYGVDISQKEWLSYYATESNISNVTGVTVMNYDVIEGDSFGDDMEVSERFMFAVFLSFFLGVFLWQPVTLLLKSMWKLRGLIKNPDEVNEAMLLFDKKNLVDLNQFKKLQEQQALLLSQQSGATPQNVKRNADGGLEIVDNGGAGSVAPHPGALSTQRSDGESGNGGESHIEMLTLAFADGAPKKEEQKEEKDGDHAEYDGYDL